MKIIGSIFLFALLVSKVDAESNSCAFDDCSCQSNESKCDVASTEQPVGKICIWDANNDCHQHDEDIDDTQTVVNGHTDTTPGAGMFVS
jgi:hypothetical protein